MVIEGYLTDVVAQPLGYANREIDLGYLTCAFQTSEGTKTINTLKPTLFNNRMLVGHSEIGVVPIEVESNGKIIMRYPSGGFPNGLYSIKSGFSERLPRNVLLCALSEAETHRIAQKHLFLSIVIKVGENIKYRLVFKQLCFDKLSRYVADVYFYNTVCNPNACQGFTVKEGSYQGGDNDVGVLPRQDTMLIPNWSFFDKDGKIYALVDCIRI